MRTQHPDSNSGMNPQTRTALLQGASNFRDLGGYATTDGRRVRHGRVFRSDHLAGLSAADVALLQGWGLSHSMDFRGVDERAATPYAVAGVQNIALSIEPTVVRKVKELLDQGVVPSHDDAVVLMCETYRDFVNHNSAAFGQFFRQLLTHRTPQVFHCTAGKDRTGFAATLLLSALKVDRATILHDYLLTNALYQRTHTQEGVLPTAVRNVLWQVQPEFLAAALSEVDQGHGGMDAYLRGPIGLSASDLAQLQNDLLLPA